MKLIKLFSLMLAPLALCATIPSTEKPNNHTRIQLKKQAALLTVLALERQFENFLGHISELGNHFVAEETKKTGLENGPRDVADLLELMFQKSSVYRAQTATNPAATENPFQEVFDGLGGILNNISNSIPTGDDNSNSLGDLVKNITDNVGNTAGDIISDVGDILGVNGTGDALSDLLNSVLNDEVLNIITDFLGNTIGGLLDGTLSITDAIDNAADLINTVAGPDNAIGKLLQSLSTYITENPDQIVALLFQFSAFVNGLIDAIAKSIGGSPAAIYDAVANMAAKIFGLSAISLHHLQNMSLSEIRTIQRIFVEAVRAQNPTEANYVQQIFNILGEISKDVFAADPTFFSFLTNPTDENIRKAFSVIYHVVTEKP